MYTGLKFGLFSGIAESKILYDTLKLFPSWPTVLVDNTQQKYNYGGTFIHSKPTKQNKISIAN